MKSSHADYVVRFLKAWMATRQMIQKANFNRFQSAGLSATQFMVLNLLPTRGKGRTLSALAKQLNLGAATLTRTIDSLETRGFLTREKSDSDKRLVSLSLTAAGELFQNEASAEFRNHISERFRRISETQQKGLVDGLESLLAADSEVASLSADVVHPERHSSRRSPRR